MGESRLAAGIRRTSNDSSRLMKLCGVIELFSEIGSARGVVGWRAGTIGRHVATDQVRSQISLCQRRWKERSRRDGGNRRQVVDDRTRSKPRNAIHAPCALKTKNLTLMLFCQAALGGANSPPTNGRRHLPSTTVCNSPLATADTRASSVSMHDSPPLPPVVTPQAIERCCCRDAEQPSGVGLSATMYCTYSLHLLLL